MALTPRFRLVTFDVTNTLLRFRNSVGDQYAKVASTYGVHCDPQKIEYAFRVHWKILKEEHPNFGRNTGLTQEAWWKKLVGRSLSHANPSLSESQLNIISDDLFHMYATSECWKLPFHIIEQLKILQKHDIILGVISNFDTRLNSVLVSTGLRGYFHFVLSSYIEGVEKPDPKIFDLALNRVQHMSISSSDAVHIGDDLHLDYLAAKNAGWNAYLLSHSHEEPPALSAMQDTIINVKNLCHCILEPHNSKKHDKIFT